MNDQYLHISYEPENGWVLSIMGRLLKSSAPRLRNAFDRWADTPLKELGFAITTRMHMLGLCIRRLNANVAMLRKELAANALQLDLSLSQGYAFRLTDKNLAYELL